MTPRQRRRRGYYVSRVADLEKDDHALFNVGEMNLRHLRATVDLRHLRATVDLRRHSRQVILTGYRYNHYMRGHEGMSTYEHLMPLTLTQPNIVSRSNYPYAERLIFLRQRYSGSYLSLIVEIRPGKRQHEVISFYPDHERSVQALRRAGLIIWEKEKDH